MNDGYDGTMADDSNWLQNVLRQVRARWWMIVGGALLGFLLAVIYLRNAAYVYTAELKVSAAESRTARPATGSLGGLASIAGFGTTTQPAAPFQLYLEGLKSREVAERLARDRAVMHTIFATEWDPTRRTWRKPPSFLGGIKRSVWDVLGLPVTPWQPPGAARLQEYLGAGVVVFQSVKSPLVTISLDSPDPKFAARFLTKLDDTVDGYLREQAQARTRSNIDYLSDKLRGVTFVEQRQALFAALSDEERSAMLANSRAPFAAQAFGVATSSLAPTKPRQIPLLLGGLVAGAILGTALAVLLGPRRPRPMVAADLDG